MSSVPNSTKVLIDNESIGVSQVDANFTNNYCNAGVFAVTVSNKTAATIPFAIYSINKNGEEVVVLQVADQAEGTGHYRVFPGATPGAADANAPLPRNTRFSIVSVGGAADVSVEVELFKI